jgi:large subunit ribosomal protein L28
MSGHTVSHANNKTKRKFNVNLRTVSLKSDILQEKFSMKIAASTMRTIDKYGGFDQFVVKTQDTKLSENALKIKRRLLKKLSPHK